MTDIKKMISNITENDIRMCILNCIYVRFIKRIQTDVDYNKKIRNLFRESTDKIKLCKKIIERDFEISIEDSDANYIVDYFVMYLSKTSVRKKISLTEKVNLIRKQNGVCGICKQKLPEKLEDIHVDHKIAFCYVGDELENNNVAACKTCNLSKGNIMIYFFLKKMMIK